MANEKITMKQGEIKTIAFLVKRNSVVLDLTAIDPLPEFKFCVKKKRSDTEYLIEKEDEDFDKADAASGIIKIIIDDTDMADMVIGSYISELKSTLATDDVDKSEIIDFVVESSVIHD